jgi:hypothetical protein
MQYVIYFAVAAPLVLGWLFWAADRPPLPPLFNTGIDNLHVQAGPPAPPSIPPDAPKRLARDMSAPRNE